MEDMMKQLIAVVCLVLASPLALAQDKSKDVEKKTPVAEERSAKGGDMKKEPTEKQKAQQERMKDCSEKAGDRKADDRKKFMSTCLKGGAMDTKADKGSAKKTAQQEKMKSCNKEAGDKKMKGGERKAFMKDCLAK
jgi:hypothetical protein